ncbi:MAG: glycosyltransferase [Candidatus Promineifilaceae bacterium]
MRKAFTFGILAAGLAWRNWHNWQGDQHKLAHHQTTKLSVPPLEQWQDRPTVSILVAAWNEGASVAALIQSFYALRYPHKQLVVCAGGTDDTFAIAQSAADERVVVVKQVAGMGKQRALHHAFPATTGDIIFLTDADCILDDDSFERTILPLTSGATEVSTGESRPLATQLDNPFIVWQAVGRLYNLLGARKTADGLLGRNCAVTRHLLERSAGLAAEAFTGTDYVLAKKLMAHGATIRHVSHSRIETRYPTTARAYIRQQRRWLRNVAWQGARFGAWGEVRQSLQTSLIGFVMLSLPLIGLFFPPLLFVWGALLWQMCLARLRYWHVGNELLREDEATYRPKFAHTLYLPYFILLDFIAWVSTLFDYVSAQRRATW